MVLYSLAFVGGFDLAAEWMGWDNIFHCEWNEFGQKILKYYWPNAISYGDITKTDFTIHRGAIDILTGGFPCQPYSLAGKRKGTEDDRHLWPEMLRAIREIQPRWIVGENVPGLVNWSKGLVFEQVQADLEAEGYEVFPVLLPACSLDAPHQRERIWFIAYSTCRRKRELQPVGARNNSQEVRGENSSGIEKFVSSGITTNTPNIRHESSRNTRSGRAGFENGNKRDVANPDSNIGCERRMYQTKPEKTERYISALNSWSDRGTWENFPTQSPICSRDDGFPPQLDSITFPKWRNESIKGFGNAIVPQVAFQIFKSIQEYELKNTD